MTIINYNVSEKLNQAEKCGQLPFRISWLPGFSVSQLPGGDGDPCFPRKSAELSCTGALPLCTCSTEFKNRLTSKVAIIFQNKPRTGEQDFLSNQKKIHYKCLGFFFYLGKVLDANVFICAISILTDSQNIIYN